MERKWLRLCAALVIANLLFIWGNSLLPGPVSAAISGFVRDIAALFLPAGGEGEPVAGEGILRKIAHVLEFCSLGLLLCMLLSMLRKPHFYSLPLGIFAGCIDECLQLLVPERGPHIRDVGIDTLGVIAGLGVFTIALAIRKHKKSTTNLEETKL